jgi:coenzyme F420-0:L-glutamate ligase
MRGFLRANAYDIVNTHSSTDTWLVALASRGWKAPPLVRTRHISAPVPDNRATRWLYRRASAHVVTTGEALREQLIRHNGLAAGHVTSVPTGIDPLCFPPTDASMRAARRRELELPVTGPLVGVVATLRSWKGHRYLLEAIKPTAEAEELAILNKEDPKFIQFVLDNSTRVLMKHPLLVQTVQGNVCINAGIDRSNTESGYILLLPEDSDRSARKIRDRIKKLAGKKVAVIITDTNGRSFREGQIGVAVGCAGIAAAGGARRLRRHCGIQGGLVGCAASRGVSASATRIRGSSSPRNPRSYRGRGRVRFRRRPGA